jgi:hypothetical protein
VAALSVSAFRTGIADAASASRIRSDSAAPRVARATSPRRPSGMPTSTESMDHVASAEGEHGGEHRDAKELNARWRVLKIAEAWAVSAAVICANAPT